MSMNLKDWRAARRGTVTLPCGLDVTLQKVALEELALGGTLPVPLLNEVMRNFRSGAYASLGADPNAPDIGKILEVAPDALKMFDALVQAALVEPSVLDEAEIREFDARKNRMPPLSDVFNDDERMRALAQIEQERQAYLDSHIDVKELGLADKEFIFNWAAAGANALAPFRAGQDQSAAAASAGSNVPHTS